jgi:ferric-dicitrate binding protein FerR (iron transport regulator)
VTIPPYARLAAKLLKREETLLPEPEPLPDALRADAVAALQRALVQRARRQRVRRSAYAGLGIAAALGLVWLAGSRLGPEPHAQRRSAQSAPPAEAEVAVYTFGAGARVIGGNARGALQAPGGRVQALANGRALLAFQTGTRVALEADSDLALVENGAAQVLALGHGALRADVAKLAPGRRFLVHTADAEVEVHGTSFRVSTLAEATGCGDASLTRVEVFEGVVSVRHAGVEHRIEKGQVWPGGCPAPSPTLLGAAAPPPEKNAARAPVIPRDNASGAAEPVAASLASDLVAQNDAFAAAVAARRAGDLARAARGFDALLARYPDGPLAESAAVQRLNVMRVLDPARARDLAREYLVRYPNGFAREQAAAWVLETP